MGNIILLDGKKQVTLSEENPFELVYAKGVGWIELEYNGNEVTISLT